MMEYLATGISVDQRDCHSSPDDDWCPAYLTMTGDMYKDFQHEMVIHSSKHAKSCETSYTFLICLMIVASLSNHSPEISQMTLDKFQSSNSIKLIMFIT
jgi:hypothetical protein